MIAGTTDELEFDPTSIAPPDFAGARAAQPVFEGSSDALPLLHLDGASPHSPPGRPRSSFPPEHARSSSPPVARSPRLDASVEASFSLPPLEVPALDVPSSKARAPEATPRKSAPPGALATRSTKDPAGAFAASFPGMGGEIDLGDGLDDLDLGGAAAAQLNVGLPDREEDDDVPWPLARTPVGDELSVSAREVEQVSGFGSAPKSFHEKPLYAWRVYRALTPLREKQQEAEKYLREVEDARDEMLAGLAEEKRSELEKSDRFTALFAQIAGHEQNIALRKRDLEMVDVEGALALREVQAELDALNVERLSKAKVRDEKRVVVETAELAQKRQQAALKRIQIEWRNIEARAQKVEGSHMPRELDAQLDVLEAQQVRAKADLDLTVSSLKEAKRLLAEAENDVRIATAGVQRAEGKKEGLLLSKEGDIAERSRALDRAVFERQQELANAGRAIVDLRGQIPVKGMVRSHLLAADERVTAAARQLEIITRALGSMDADAYGTGRAVWIGGLLFLFVLLVLSAL